MASKRARRRHGCAGKKRYQDLAKARHDSAYLARRDGRPVDVYRCPNCGEVHVGHRPLVGASPRIVT